MTEMADNYMTTFHRNYKPLFDKVKDFEIAVPKMKKFIKYSIENVSPNISSMTLMSYEREFERMNHFIKESERNVQGKLELIYTDAVRADKIYDFFNPDTFGIWLKLQKDLVEYKDVLWVHLENFFDFMPRYVSFTKRVKEEFWAQIEDS